MWRPCKLVGKQAGAGTLNRLCPLRSVGVPVVCVPDHAATASCMERAASLVRPRAAPGSPWRARHSRQARCAVLGRSALVLKKLGDELLAEFVRVLQFLGVEEGMRVLVEPHEYIKLVGRAGLGFIDTYTPAEASKYGRHEPLHWVFRTTYSQSVPSYDLPPGRRPPIAPADSAHGQRQDT